MSLQQAYIPIGGISCLTSQLVNLSTRQPVNLSTRQPVNLLTCKPVNLLTLLTCKPVNLLTNTSANAIYNRTCSYKVWAVHNVNNGGAYSSAGATEHFPIASAK